MATNRFTSPQPEQPEARSNEAIPAELAVQQRQERRLHGTLQTGAAAQILIGVAVTLAICYVAKPVLVTLLVSVLFAFMLEPVVSLLQRARIPRSAGALIAVLFMLSACWGATYFFYGRAVGFAQELPSYSKKIREMIAPVVQQTKNLKQTTEKILPPSTQVSRKAVPVKVENTGTSVDFLTRNAAMATELALTVSFIPFLVYFMLSWQEQARARTVQLFRAESRATAYVTLGQISLMVRAFIVGNFAIGVFMSLVGMLVFGILGLPYFYFLAFISGFLSLVPYLGVVLAAIPPLIAGLGTLSKSELIIIVLVVLGLHVFALNVLYPRFLGKRVQLNPLTVTMSLLVWGWIWGAMGLVLAVPVMGAIKIVCDNVRPLQRFGEWIGD